MKKVSLSIACMLSVALLYSCNSSSENNNNTASDSISTVVNSEEQTGMGRIEFTERTYDFGDIKEGEVVEHVFTLKNTGNAPVILAQVSASCGCTTPEYTSVPIKPGAEGEIKVRFDSKGQLGNQQKIVTIQSNAENNVETVQITGSVSAK